MSPGRLKNTWETSAKVWKDFIPLYLLDLVYSCWASSDLHFCYMLQTERNAERYTVPRLMIYIFLLVISPIWYMQGKSLFTLKVKLLSMSVVTHASHSCFTQTASGSLFPKEANYSITVLETSLLWNMYQSFLLHLKGQHVEAMVARTIPAPYTEKQGIGIPLHFAGKQFIFRSVVSNIKFNY